MVAITLQISTLRASSHPLSEQTRFLLETVFSLAFAPHRRPASCREQHETAALGSRCPGDTMLARVTPLQPQPGGSWCTTRQRTRPEGLPWAPSRGFRGSVLSGHRWKALSLISTAVPNLAGTRDCFRGRQLFPGWCGRGMVSG